MIFAAIVGAISGAVQFWILFLLTQRIGKGRTDFVTVLFGILQVFLPLVPLLGVALFYSAGLLSCGIAYAASLIVISVIFVIIKSIFCKKGGE